MRSNNEDSDSDEMEIDIDIVGILRRRFLHITLGLMIGATIATIYFFQQVPIYESSLTVLVGQRSSELASTGQSRGGSDGITVQDDILATHVELITSRKIIENAITKGGLLVGAGEILGGLKISKGGAGAAKTASVLKASYQAPNPELAAKVLQAVFDSYFAYIEEKSRNVGAEAATLISNSLVQCEQELKDADEAYRDYITAFPAVVANGGDKLENIHGVRLQKIEGELSGVRGTLSQLRSRQAVIKEFARGKKPEELSDLEVMTLLEQNEVTRLLTVVNINNAYSKRKQSVSEMYAEASNRVAINYEQKLLELTSKKEQLESTLGASHPLYRNIVKEIASVQYIINSAKRNAVADDEPESEAQTRIAPSEMLLAYVNILNGDIRELEAREKELLVLSEEESRMAKEIETSFLESTSYRSRLDRARSRYEQVFARLQEISLTNSSSGFSTDLIVPPTPNGIPIWPSKTKIAAIGLLAGGMIGLGLALLAEFTDRTFRNPDDVEQLTKTSILAHIPKIDVSKVKKNQKASFQIAPMVTTFHAPRGSAAETFRVLRTAVLYLAKKDSKKVIMITSPSPADGKSTTIANLAVSLAQTGKKVLLIDGDLRRPNVAKTFGIQKPVGLTNYITANAEIADCCHPCDQVNLTICPDGAPTSHPAELLQSDRFAKFLSEARQSYDVILIDAPPLLAVADPAIIGSVVDSCFLTMRVERNNRSLVERACEILNDNSTPLDGVIINSLNSKTGGYGYSAYNYYGKKEYGYVDAYRRYYAVRSEVPLLESNAKTNGVHPSSPASLNGTSNGSITEHSESKLSS